MKKINLFVLAAMIMVAVCQSCNSDKKADAGNEKEFMGTKAVLDQPVDYSMALECLNKYSSLLNNPFTKKTNYVTFDKKALGAWLKQTDSLGTYDNIQVSFGRYTEKILGQYGKDTNLKNRLTVFLFPYVGKVAATKDKVGKANDKIEPFNMGEVHP